MERLKDETQALISAIKDTEIYKEYIRAAKETDVESAEKIKRYKELMKAAAESKSQDGMGQAEALYREIMLNPETRRLAVCEKRLLKLVTEIYDEIGSQIDII